MLNQTAIANSYLGIFVNAKPQLMKNILFILLNFLFVIDSFTQTKVGGIVMDGSTKTPIEFAAVTILKPGDSLIITGTITDGEGKFLLTEIKPGSYTVRVNFLGYDDAEKNIDVAAGAPFVGTGPIIMQPGVSNLDEVNIIADKSYFQNSIDKKVYNIEKDIVASGGNASDALQTIPSVSIDIDGNISLRGSQGVVIFIDGKPSGIVGSNMNAILEQIPAANIESIEVVTNPSARYDAEGSSGIINIVMKKNKKVGLNGNVMAGVTTTPKYETGISLNYRNNKVNIYTNYSLSHDERNGYGNNFRKTFEEDTTYYFSSLSNNLNINLTNMLRGGMDFYLNDKNTIGFTGSFMKNNSDRNDDVHYEFLNEDSVLTSTSDRTTINENEGMNYTVGINYRKTFSSAKHVLTADGYYSYGKMDDMSDYDERFFDPALVQIGLPLLQTISKPGTNKDANIQMDYVHPFKNGNQFETGLKYSKEIKDNTIYSETFSDIENDWIADDSINNQFIYDEDIFAAYVIWNSSIDKFGYQIGLRAEQTYTNSDLVTTDENFVNNYFGLFPSAHVAYKFNEETELTLSYSRRLDRPNSWFLNPFPDYSDPYSLRMGNPDLEAEYENSYDLEFAKSFKKHSYSGSIYYHQTLNEISPYTVIDSNGISLMTFQNYNNEEKYGVELISKNEFYKWWNMTSTFNFNQTLVDAQNLELGLTNSTFNYTIRVMSFFQVLKQTALQLTFSYSTPWTFAQGESEPIYYVDAGIKSDFFQNKLSVNLSFSDIFDTRIWEGYSEGINFHSDYSRKRESQIAGIKLTYKFGQQDAFRKKGSRMDENYDGGGYDMF